MNYRFELRLLALLILTAFLTISCGSNLKETQRTAISAISGPNLRFVLSFGSFGSSQGSFLDPRGISVSQIGNIYVADTGNDRIQEFDANGSFVKEVWGFGWDSAEFNRPKDVCADFGLEVYVADSQNRRIQRFDLNLNFLEVIDSIPGLEGEGFGTPEGIAISPQGDIYVADSENDVIVKIDPFARSGSEFAYVAYADGRLLDPTGIVVGSDGNIYVCDTGNSRIAVFDPFGSFLRSFGEGILIRPEGIDVDRKGVVFVVDSELNAVFAFDHTGRSMMRFGTFGSGPGSFRLPNDVASDDRGHIYLLDSGNSRVQKFEVIWE